tara:strand:- start:275 stop:466 length:192 start_codon:yes stop_codon:yes gene_type:complete
MNFIDALEYVIATLEHAIEMNQEAGAPHVVIDTLVDACNHAYDINILLNDETDIADGLEGVEE